jgi:hypothetical protein
VSKIAKATKKKVGQVKDHVASTSGTSNEKPHKDDEVGKKKLNRMLFKKNMTLVLVQFWNN